MGAFHVLTGKGRTVFLATKKAAIGRAVTMFTFPSLWATGYAFGGAGAWQIASFSELREPSGEARTRKWGVTT